MMNIEIEHRKIGEGYPCYIIAEAGINHNGSVKIAKQMIDVAKECKVDAVKFQTFTAEEFVNNEDETYEYKSQGKQIKEPMMKMFKRHEFTEEEWSEIVSYCNKKNLTFLSTPQNISDLELLLDYGISAIKVGSDDLTNLELLETYSKKGLPMLISTGMGYMSEIDEAIRTIKKYNNKLAVFHCISSYPTEFSEVNLKAIKTLQKSYPRVVVGFSDHTFGIEAPIAATALGMKIYEKHFTLDHDMQGPDHKFSANPNQLNKIVKGIRNIERGLGDGKIRPSKNELDMREIAQRSIVANSKLQKGKIITEDDLIFKRPGTGIPPKNKKYLLGRKLNETVEKNELITLDKLK